ncbi:uncharacterized protein LOC128557748 isoform X2 [Mercenaria mercenaria]|nr:uncharacterized protein LOC128557748 isoform X2 [Mercenaria mercenaria]XP_053401899.1 uncharacterized protein LOC128557748 isoform X2 [Mercenaria mercenaria]
MGTVKTYSILMYFVLLTIHTCDSATVKQTQEYQNLPDRQNHDDEVYASATAKEDKYLYDTSVRPKSELQHTTTKVGMNTNDSEIMKILYFTEQRKKNKGSSDIVDIGGNTESRQKHLVNQTADPNKNTRNHNIKEYMHTNPLVKQNVHHFSNKILDINDLSETSYKKLKAEFSGASQHIRKTDKHVGTPQNALTHSKSQRTHSRFKCNIEVLERSKTKFHSQLISRDPNFIQFNLTICDSESARTGFTSDVFQGHRWFWTYNASSGPYPFLSWNLDYGILSFHLLEAKTINIPYVSIKLKSPDSRFGCDFTFGDYKTSLAVTAALIPLINVTEGGDYIKYPESYFCYLTTRQEYFGSVHYWAAVYLYYPISFVHYKCCSASLNYTSGEYDKKCQGNEKHIAGVHSWTVTKTLPYLLGVLFLLYFPVMFFKIAAWLAKEERIYEDLVMVEMADDIECLEFLDDCWKFADGQSPLTLGDLLSFKTLGLTRHPVIVSRLRRLLFVLSFPIFIYIQLAMYTEGFGQWRSKITVKDLVKVGTPMGFLALLADADDRRRVFVPILGGPVGVVTIYYTLSLLFIALPRSVKQVVEAGLPSSNLVINSPLFFGTSEIIQMSMINVKARDLKPGYTKASTLMKCRFYMLFTRLFWKELWNIQTERITTFLRPTSTCCRVLLLPLFLPFYVIFCATEVICCIVFHGIPFCTFVSGMLNGGIKSLRYLRGQSLILNAVFRYRGTCFLGVSFVFISFMVYIYVISLVFLVSFGFISQIITHCFVAIIIYPSVSFGYLFFFIVLFYYFINLVRDFGGVYMELLATTVDISRHLSNESARIAVYNGQLTVSNVQVENIVDVRINGVSLHVPLNILRTIQTQSAVRVKQRNSTYGIPKDLFEYIVKKHRPVHQQVVILCIKAVIMITFVILTLSISADYVAGPTSEISEVMHVIFIVAVGALPQLVQAILARSDTVLVREIEEREIEKSTIEFWNKESADAQNHRCVELSQITGRCTTQGPKV